MSGNFPLEPMDSFSSEDLLFFSDMPELDDMLFADLGHLF